MKRITLAASLCIITCMAFSQTILGMKGGLNVANIGGDAVGVTSKADFHAGVFALIRRSDSFALQPEIVYSRQGAQAAENSKIKFNYDYLNVPFMLDYFPSDRFFFQTGPQLGFLLSGKVKDDSGSFDVTDQLNSVDFSLGLGIGYSGPASMINLRYNVGLTNTSESTGAKFPNRVLQISIGYRFQ